MKYSVFSKIQALALYISILADKFDEPGLFPTPTMTGLYRKPSVLTWK